MMQEDIRLNKIISFLPSAIIDEWAPDFEHIDLQLGQVLYEPGRVLGHLYFPLTAIVSWVRILENGASTKVAITGREGVVGIYLLMGAEQTLNRAIVQKPGSALRLRLSAVLNKFNHGNEVQRIFLRYTQTLFNQMAQGSVCHRHHSLEQQLCCMLLLTLDRQDSPTIVLTHELLASLLGVRREGVTQAARRLMQQNFIRYSRGNITVLNRTALEQRSCECYNVINNEYNRFLSVT
jgi:CRP-like cAMP-binding protein